MWEKIIILPFALSVFDIKQLKWHSREVPHCDLLKISHQSFFKKCSRLFSKVKSNLYHFEVISVTFELETSFPVQRPGKYSFYLSIVLWLIFMHYISLKPSKVWQGTDFSHSPIYIVPTSKCLIYLVIVSIVIGNQLYFQLLSLCEGINIWHFRNSTILSPKQPIFSQLFSFTYYPI